MQRCKQTHKQQRSRYCFDLCFLKNCRDKGVLFLTLKKFKGQVALAYIDILITNHIHVETSLSETTGSRHTSRTFVLVHVTGNRYLLNKLGRRMNVCL